MLYMASALPDFHNETDLCDSAVESVRNFNFNGFTVICGEIFITYSGHILYVQRPLLSNRVR